jgi:hypothetical protein
MFGGTRQEPVSVALHGADGPKEDLLKKKAALVRVSTGKQSTEQVAITKAPSA